MKLLEIILSFVSNNFSAVLLWFYNKKVDENIKLEVDLKTIKEETEIKTKEEKLTEQKKISDDKVLTFKQKMKEYKGELS